MSEILTSIHGKRLGLDADGNLVIAGSAVRYSTSRVVATDGDLTLTREAHAEKIVVVNKASGAAVTLPAATGSGDKYTVIIGTAVTSNNVVVGVTGSAVMFGTIFGKDGDGDPGNAWASASGNNKVSLGGTSNATGGKKGDRVEFIDMAADAWQVTGWISQDGTEATPFGTAS